MPIQLDKILADIADEKILHPNYPNANKNDVDDAWSRVGKNNKLSVHEARSIFKVLQKKYDQEKAKESSSWKLYNIMEQIHRKIEFRTEAKSEDDCDMPLEEDEEYEMLEVQEDDEPMSCNNLPPASTGSMSDNDSPTKSRSSSIDSHDRELITISATPITTPTRQQNNLTPVTLNNTNYTTITSTQSEEKKLLNTLAGSSSRAQQQQHHQNSTQSQVTTIQQQQQNAAAAAVTLNKKGITLKKTTPTTTTVGCTTIYPKTQTAATNTTTLKGTTVRSNSGAHLIEVGKTIQVSDSMKRKFMNEEQQQQQTPKLSAKKLHLLQSSPTSQTSTTSKTTKQQTPQQHITTTTQLMQIKSELTDEQLNNDIHSIGINVITIPANTELSNGIITGHGGVGGGAATGAGAGTNANSATSGVGVGVGIVGPSSSTAATVASTSTNGFSPRLEDIDFKNDIIFEPTGGIINNITNKCNRSNSGEIINLGNFDNSLPPTFFKNLCNSSRHESLGLYIANVMNRLRPKTAAKLELDILRAVIDAKSDELEMTQ